MRGKNIYKRQRKQSSKKKKKRILSHLDPQKERRAQSIDTVLSSHSRHEKMYSPSFSFKINAAYLSRAHTLKFDSPKIKSPLARDLLIFDKRRLSGKNPRALERNFAPGLFLYGAECVETALLYWLGVQEKEGRNPLFLLLSRSVRGCSRERGWPGGGGGVLARAALVALLLSAGHLVALTLILMTERGAGGGGGGGATR